MELFVAIIVLGLLAVGIFVGIAFNVSLYSRGAFGMRYMEHAPDLGTVTLSQEATSDEDYYISLGSAHSGTTLRHLALYAFIAVVVLSMLMIYFSTFVGR
jgi:hypothetical protein